LSGSSCVAGGAGCLETTTAATTTTRTAHWSGDGVVQELIVTTIHYRSGYVPVDRVLVEDFHVRWFLGKKQQNAIAGLATTAGTTGAD
jgi:hypothetical protein